ncbi:hypothetical protein [Loigolactobacillus zhaoyuanensis]|uniref:Uncharacterized protein n=1 Tax=Loigolactobacillus zhaoyuanensis TaxID=2486017 RepID=A0ABW8UAL6_9LACO|nr:hypothetical protein [Loigolactobacillus zhaoyuanensis]
MKFQQISKRLSNLQAADYKITIPHFYCLAYVEHNRKMTIELDFRDPQLQFDSSMIQRWDAPHAQVALSQADKQRISQNIRHYLMSKFPDQTKSLMVSDTMTVEQARAIIKNEQLDGRGFFQNPAVLGTPSVNNAPAGYAVYTVGEQTARYYPSKSKALVDYIKRLRVHKQAEHGQIVGLNVRLIKELQYMEKALQAASYEKDAARLAQILTVLSAASASGTETISALASFISLVNVRYLGELNISDYAAPYSWTNRVAGAKHFAQELITLLAKVAEE